VGWALLHRTDPHTLAGPYALDALGPADRARFERHLAGCPACRQETQGLRETTALLGTAAYAPPPEGLRERVMAAVTQTRPGTPASRPARWPAWVARWAARRPAGPGRRWAVAVACGALAVALVFGGLAYHSQRQLSQEQSRARAVAAVLGAPDARMMTARSASRGMATVVMSHQQRALVFTATRLPGLPAAQRYELWLVAGGRARPAGMLPAAQHGVTAPVLVSGLRAGDTVALTVEPAAGASRPTSPMIVHVALPS
jgi:Anti-sigma-K factor rskA, C-terminal/Anti-sigma-K factor RskA, N-terminal domain